MDNKNIIRRKRRNNYMPLIELQEICREHNVNTIKEYHEQYKSFVSKSGLIAPTEPNKIYADDGWQSWSQLTGDKTKFMPLQDLIEFCKNANMTSMLQYGAIYKSFSNEKGELAPANPNAAYKDVGWAGWWQLTGTTNKDFMTLEQLQQCCKDHNISSRKEYYAKFKEMRADEDKRAPAKPHVIYKDIWQGWIQLTGNKWVGDAEYSNFMSLEELKVICKNANVKSGADYRKLYSTFKTANGKTAPQFPAVKYKNLGWKSWNDLTVKQSQKNRNYMPMDELIVLCEQRNISCEKHYRRKYKTLIGKDDKIAPSNPYYAYGDKWSWKTASDVIHAKRKSKITKVDFKNLRWGEKLELTKKFNFIENKTK